MILLDDFKSGLLLFRQPGWLSRILCMPHEVGWPASLSEDTETGWAPRDEGVHPDPSWFYFEWWYCDAQFDQGYTMTISLHLVDPVRPAGRKGQLNLHIFTPEGVPHHVVRKTQCVIRKSIQKCDIEIGNGRLSGRLPIYKLSVVEENLGVDLTFESELPAWKPGTGQIRFGRHLKRHFTYTVPQPRAHVEGSIRVNGKVIPVSGVGYHEHAWGNIPLVGAVPRWYWGRVYSKEHSLIYANLILGSNFGDKHVTPVMVARRGVIVGDTLRATLQLDDFCWLPGFPCPYPATVHLKIDDPRFSGYLTLRKRHLIEAANILSASNPLRRWLIARLIAEPIYFRIMADVDGELSFGGKIERIQCTTIHDMMLWRPE